MSNSTRASALEVRISSAANNLHDLRLDIQDAMVDLWHHPRISERALGQREPGVDMHIQVLLNLAALRCARPAQLQADIASICRWLRSHQVSYEIGHSPLIPAHPSTPKSAKELHRLVLIARAAKQAVSR